MYKIKGMKYLDNSSKKLFLMISPKVVGIFATICAFAISVFRGIENLGVADAQGYINQANGVLKGISFVFDDPSAFGHNLGFSYLIAMTFVISNSTSLLLLKLILVFSHGIAAYLLAQIGREIGLKRGAWIAASVLFSLDPFVLYSTTSVGTENLTTLIVIYWCYLYVIPNSSRSYLSWQVLLFTFSGLFSILMRPNFLFPFIFVSILLFTKWRNDQLPASTLIFSVSLFLISFSAYELFLTKLNDAFVFLATYGGFGIAYACRPEFIPQYLGIATTEQNEKINYWLNVENPMQASILAKNPSLSIVEIDKEMMRLGISTCLENPIESLGILGLKFFAIWRPFTAVGSYGLMVFIFSAIILVPLTYGIARFLFRKNLPARAFSVKKFFIVVSMGFVPSLLITTEQLRHRLAFAEPFYWLFSVACIQYWLVSKNSRVTNRKLKRITFRK